MNSIFLSHSHNDKVFARRLAADLRREGHIVWIDEAEINVGDSLIEKIRQGIDQVDYVVVLLSTASINSEWVKKELDVASNREIEEKRVVILPLMIERVTLPGFLKGKFYVDFTSEDRYGESFALLLRKLGPATPVPVLPKKQLAQLKRELAQAREEIRAHKAEIEAHRTIALRGKSPELVKAIAWANKQFPQHAPINVTYAFEVLGMPVTLDYLLLAINKAEQRGGHPLDALLTIDKKWSSAEAMLSAYSEMLESTNREKPSARRRG